MKFNENFAIIRQSPEDKSTVIVIKVSSQEL